MRLMMVYSRTIKFVAPQAAHDDAKRRVPELLEIQRVPPVQIAEALASLETVLSTVRPVPESLYQHGRRDALRRIERRDPDDWPILATAIELGSPIWTDDQDFFGTGVATWSTPNVEIYLSKPNS
jgi:predicted nucleic acid-binding protein